MPSYLKLDSTRVTFAEYWHWKPGVPFLLLAAGKVLGLRWPANVLTPEEPGINLLEPAEVPGNLRDALEPVLSACAVNGRTLEVWYSVATIGAFQGVAAALPSRDGRSLAVATVAAASPKQNEVALGVFSRVRDARFVLTTGNRSLFNPPPEIERVWLSGASFGEVLAAHDALLNGRQSDIEPVGETVACILELQRLTIRANRARGLYVPALGADVERAAGRLNDRTHG